MPQPIDVNTELARITTAQRVQEVADRASLAAQQRQAQQAQQERLSAETVVNEPPQSEHDVPVGDRREGRGHQQRKPRSESHGGGQDSSSSHGAGDIAVIPDPEEHRLDVNV